LPFFTAMPSIRIVLTERDRAFEMPDIFEGMFRLWEVTEPKLTTCPLTGRVMELDAIEADQLLY
jgi:hypothetical protein